MAVEEVDSHGDRLLTCVRVTRYNVASPRKVVGLHRFAGPAKRTLGLARVPAAPVGFRRKYQDGSIDLGRVDIRFGRVGNTSREIVPAGQ